MNGIMCDFGYAGMPFEEAERSMKCFAKYVLPELKKWKVEAAGEEPKLLDHARPSRKGCIES